MAAKTKTDAERLAEIRERIGALQDELVDLDQRPVSRDEAIAAADSWMDQKAAAFTHDLNLNDLIKGKPHARLYPISQGETDWQTTLCALFPDTVRDFLVEQIDAELGEREPISNAEREERRQEIRDELFKLEQQDEEIVARKEAAGETVTRRGDADVRAVLGLQRPPERPAPMPTETPEPTKHREAHGTVYTHELPRRTTPATEE